jgi:hypothetical protein
MGSFRRPFARLSLLTHLLALGQQVAENIPPPAPFYAAVLFTVTGVLLYELAAPPPAEKRAAVIGADDEDLEFELAPVTPNNGNVETRAIV